jgi:acyl-CoA thioesterase I
MADKTNMRTQRTQSRIWRALPLLGVLLVVVGCSSASTGPTGARATPTPTVRAAIVYVALGASDALGVGADSPNTEGYIPRIIARLPLRAQALNLGISGIGLHDALARELPQALATQPTLVTVWLAGNDFRGCVPLAQYGADLDRLLAQLHDQTHAQVFVANLPDMSQLPYFKQGAPNGGACVEGASADAVRNLVAQWNNVINAAVARHGDVLVDLFRSSLAGHQGLVASDGFHPSSQGYAILADLFWQQISVHDAAIAGA